MSTIDTSGIDATKPIFGNPSTESVRDNFAAIILQLNNAASDIDAAGTPDAVIAGLAGVTINADQIHYGTGLNIYAVTTLTAFARSNILTSTGGLTLTDHLILPAVNDPVTPTLSFGNGDTGLYAVVDDALSFSFAGTRTWDIDGTVFQSTNTSGAGLRAAAASATIPGFYFTGDSDTGMGWAGANQLSLITAGIEAIRIDASQNVGIGTSTPNAKLEVLNGDLFVTNGGGNAQKVIVSNSQLSLDVGINNASIPGGAAITTTTAFPLMLGTANIKAIHIDTNQNVGIGVVPEAWDVSHSALQVGAYTALVNEFTTRTVLSNNVYYDSGGTKYIATDEASRFSQQNGTYLFQVAPSGVADAAITWSTALTIDNAGNVGIGTSGILSDRVTVEGGGITAQSLQAIGSPSYWGSGQGIGLSYGAGVGSIRAYNNSSGTGTATINFITGGISRAIIGLGGIFVAEIAAAEADVAAYGQVWVRNDIPNTLMFTDDTGVDYAVAGSTVLNGLWIDSSPDAYFTGGQIAVVGTGIPTFSNWSASYGVIQLGLHNAIWGHNTTDFLNITSNVYYDSQFKYYVGREASRYEQRDGTHVFSVAPVGTADAVISWTTALTINNSGKLIIPLGSFASAPSLAFGDGDTGFYEFSDDALGLSIGGTERLYFSAIGISSTTLFAPEILTSVGTTTAPNYTFRSDNDTGFSRSGTNQLSLITAGVERIRLGAAGGIHVGEVAAAEVNVAGYGQIWVRNDIANTLIFTDDAGVDYEVAGSTVTSSPWTINGNDIHYDTGYIGVGQTPNAGWAFYNAIQFGDAAAISGDSNYTNITHNLYAYGNNSWRLSTANIASLYQQAAGDHSFYKAISGVLGSIAAPVLTFRVDDAGNAGFAFSPRGNQSAADTHLSIGANAQVWATSAAGVSSKLAIGQNVYEHSTGDLYLNTDEASKYEQINGTHVFNVAVSGTAGAAISWTTALTINNGGQLIIPLVNNAAAPSLSFGDGDSGFYQAANGQIQISINGVGKLTFGNGWLFSGISNDRGALKDSAVSSTNPSYVANNADSNTGMGWAGADQLSFITGAVERVRIGAAGGVLIAEIAAAEADVVGYGQIWVKNDVANTLWFTDDAGADFQIGGTGLSAGGWSATGTDLFIVDATVTDSYFGDAATDAAPALHTLHGQGALGTNIAGADLIVAAGQGTGTGIGGELQFHTAPAGTTGAALNALTNRFTISEAGHIGFGTTDFEAWSSNYHAMQFGDVGAIAVEDTDSSIAIVNNGYENAAGWRYKTTAVATRYEQAYGGHYFYFAASGTIDTFLPWTQAVTIQADGDLYCHKDLILAQVALGGNGTATDPTFSNSAATAGMYFDGGGSNLAFSVNNAQRLLISAGGQAVLGATAAKTWYTAANPYHSLQIGDRTTIYGDEGAAGGMTYNAYYSTAGWKYIEAAAAAKYELYSTALKMHEFEYAADGLADGAVTWTTALLFNRTNNRWEMGNAIDYDTQMYLYGDELFINTNTAINTGVRLSNSVAGQWYMEVNTTGQYTVNDGTDDYFYADSTKFSAGIGTADLHTWSSVEGPAAQFIGKMNIGNGLSSPAITRNAYYNAGWKRQAVTIWPQKFEYSSGSWIFQYAAASTVDSAITWVDQFVINTSGHAFFDAATNDRYGWHTSHSAVQVGAYGAIQSIAGRTELNHNTYYANSGSLDKYMQAGLASQVSLDTGKIILQVAASGAKNGTITWIEALNIDPLGNVAIGSAALATTATDGFLYIPTCAGAPTGTPTSQSGRVPIIFDTVNNQLYVYDVSWIKTVALT